MNDSANAGTGQAPGHTARALSPSGEAAVLASGADGGVRHLTHTNTAGSRAYDLYVPPGYAGEPVPLVVMLHAGGQDAKDFAASTRMNELAERGGFSLPTRSSPERPATAGTGTGSGPVTSAAAPASRRSWRGSPAG
jgi:poly(3-hydroxybutyrate) depolymerase